MAQQSIFRNISWLGISTVLVKPLWFLFITATCMRILGASDYGVLTTALSLAMLGTLFTDVGTSRYSTREIARDHSLAGRFFTNFFVLRLVVSFFAFAGILGTAVVLDYSSAALVATAFAAVYRLSMGLTQYCRAVYQSFEDLRYESITVVLEKILVIGGGLTLLLTTRTPEWTLGGMAAAMVLFTVFNIWWTASHVAPLDLELFDWSFVRGSMRTLIPLGIAGLFTHVYFKTDLVMVEAMLGETQAGQYGAAFGILDGLAVVTSIVTYSVLYPRLSRLSHSNEKGAFGRLLKRSLWGLGLVGTLTAGGITLFAPVIIHLLSPDPAFVPAVPALRLLSWTFPLLCINSLLYSALISRDDQKYLMVVMILAAATNIGANLLAIPRLGIMGAAGATLLSELLLISVYVHRYWSLRGMAVLTPNPAG